MKCPACGSGNVVSGDAGGYKCRSCGATFYKLRKGPTFKRK